MGHSDVNPVFRLYRLLRVHGTAVSLISTTRGSSASIAAFQTIVWTSKGKFLNCGNVTENMPVKS